MTTPCLSSNKLLRAYFGMDANALVSDTATDELAIELDEILTYNLYRQGSVNGVGTFQYGSTSLGASLPSGQTQESWDKRLLELTTRAATAVLNQKRVYPNWILGGTEWQIHYGNLAMWRTNVPELPMRTIVQPNGTILDQFQLYIATLPFPAQEAIMGYKGSDYVDATAFYLPYIPVELTGVLFDPTTQKRTMSWLTRYAIYNNAFSGQSQSYAYMKLTGNAISGMSYPSQQEYR